MTFMLRSESERFKKVVNEMKEYDESIERLMYTYYYNLSEKDKRHYAAVEAAKLGHGGINYISELFGCCRQTIATALEELKKTK